MSRRENLVDRRFVVAPWHASVRAVRRNAEVLFKVLLCPIEYVIIINDKVTIIHNIKSMEARMRKVLTNIILGLGVMLLGHSTAMAAQQQIVPGDSFASVENALRTGGVRFQAYHGQKTAWIEVSGDNINRLFGNFQNVLTTNPNGLAQEDELSGEPSKALYFEFVRSGNALELQATEVKPVM